MKMLPRFVDWFRIDTQEDPTRQQQRLLYILTGLTLAIYFLPELYQESPQEPEFLLALFFGTVLLIVFWLTNKNQSTAATWLLLLSWQLDIIIDWVIDPAASSLQFETMLIFGLVQALILLSWQRYILFSLFQFGSILLVVTQANASMASFSYRIYLLTAILLGVAAWLRDQDRAYRLKNQQRLRQERDYLQSLIDSLDSPFYVLDAKTYRVITANHAARSLGISEQSIGQVTCHALTHGNNEPCSGVEHPCPLQQVSQNRQPYTTEHIHYRPDGTPYYAEVHGFPLFDENGNVIQMVEYSIDITERKRREAEVLRLQQAVENAASSVVITDLNGTFIYANPAMEQLTGYSREELLGKDPSIFKSGHHKQDFYNHLWQTIESGQVWQGEILNKRKDGTLYWEFQTIAPVRNQNGQVINYVAIKEDITARKEIEEALHQAKEDAERASQMKSRLVSNISHDIRTPLGAIIGFADMLIAGVYGPLNQQQIEPLRTIVESANRLAQFMNDMLLRAELESGQLKIKPAPFQPAQLFKLLDSHEFKARQKGLTLEAWVDPNLPETLLGDIHWLGVILGNLVDNAIKYTDSGRVTVRLRRHDLDAWAIEVNDTGIGIPPEMHETIFESFEQVASGPGKKIEGIGLGLAIVRDITRQLGGEIHLESTPGQGSTFTVIFPLEPAE